MTSNSCFGELSEKGLFERVHEYRYTDSDLISNKDNNAKIISDHSDDEECNRKWRHLRTKQQNVHGKLQNFIGDHSIEKQKRPCKEKTEHSSSLEHNSDFLHMFSELSPRDKTGDLLDDNNYTKEIKSNKYAPIKQSGSLYDLPCGQISHNSQVSNNSQAFHNSKFLRSISKRSYNDNDCEEGLLSPSPNGLGLGASLDHGDFFMTKPVRSHKKPKLDDNQTFRFCDGNPDAIAASKNNSTVNQNSTKHCRGYSMDDDCGYDNKENLPEQLPSDISGNVIAFARSSSQESVKLSQPQISQTPIVRLRTSPYDGVPCQMKISKTVSRSGRNEALDQTRDSDSMFDRSMQLVQNKANQGEGPLKKDVVVEPVVPMSRSFNTIIDEAIKQKITLDDLPHPSKLRKSKASTKIKSRCVSELDMHQKQLHKKSHAYYGSTPKSMNSSEITSIRSDLAQRSQLCTPIQESCSLFDIYHQFMSAQRQKGDEYQSFYQQPVEGDMPPNHFSTTPETIQGYRALDTTFEGHSLHDTTWTSSAVLSTADYLEDQALLWSDGKSSSTSPFLPHQSRSSTQPKSHDFFLHDNPQDSSFSSPFDLTSSRINAEHIPALSRTLNGSLFKPDLSPIPELSATYPAFFEEE